MQPKRLKHLGVDSFLTERKNILNLYDKAKEQTSDDPVKVDHGFEGEALVRDWLSTFLPKRFGVCKGFIITTNLELEGTLEEWDIIIYDAIESPILYTRGETGKNENEIKRAIPIEYVRGVIEVKATLSPKNAEKAVNKLLKLQAFLGENKAPAYPEFLCHPFISSVIFFETKVKNLSDYRKSLDHFLKIKLETPLIPFLGSLVPRSQVEPDHSGYLQFIESDSKIGFRDVFELSSEFELANGKFGIFGSLLGYGANQYQTYMFDLLACLKGTKSNLVSSFYGLNFENPKSSWLFNSS